MLSAICILSLFVQISLESSANDVTSSGAGICMSDDDCGWGAKCNRSSVPECQCRTGYTGDKISCRDIDECSQGYDICGSNATCGNTDGSYVCQCMTGFTGDGATCSLIIDDNGQCDDEATRNCHVNAACAYLINGSSSCVCKPGFGGNGTICEDIDECFQTNSTCGTNATCTNTEGSYFCHCRIGFTGSGETCYLMIDDYNDCGDTTADECHDNATCVYLNGSFSCVCMPGFTGNGKFCGNLDDCNSISNPCHENAVCTNSSGQFECECKSGYHGDGISCDADQSSKLIWFSLTPIAIIVVMICIAFFKTRGQLRRPDDQMELRRLQRDAARASTRILIKDLKEFYVEEIKKGFEGVDSQFQRLENNADSTHTLACFSSSEDCNRTNRCPDILPFPHNRVILRDDHTRSGYINASYILDSTKAERFIAAQTPVRGTVNDFWQMIWENNVRIIVTFESRQEEENNDVALMPDPFKSTSSGDFIIKRGSKQERGTFSEIKCFITNFCCRKKEERVITQFHYFDWPDVGVPVVSGTLALHESVMKLRENLQMESPILVHCCNGSGRTGTFIALSNLISEMEKSESINIFRTVEKLRKQRLNMVQNQKQYRYLHKVVAERHILGSMKKSIHDVDDYSKEFKRECGDGVSDDFDEHARILKELSGGQIDEEISRKFDVVTVYRLTDACIVTSDPVTKEDVSSFCELIFENRVSVVIMLSARASPPCMQYWWENGDGGTTAFGQFSISCTDGTHYGFDERHLTFTRENGGKIAVLHLQHPEWRHDVPSHRWDFMNMIERVQDYRKNEANNAGNLGPILVHANAGSTRSVLFCALYNLLRVCKHEENTDVLRIVKDVSDALPGKELDNEQLAFCYSALKLWMRPRLTKEHNE